MSKADWNTRTSGVARGWALGNCPRILLKCYQLPNAEKSWYTCMFEDPTGVIVAHCLLL